MNTAGTDSSGNVIKSVKDMWIQEIGSENEPESNSKRKDWYSNGISYWERAEASVDGVLGGYGFVNDTDIKGSDAFVKTILRDRFGNDNRSLVALDCGSGIGRVTKNLLLRYFNEVDLLEPVSHLLDTARENLTSTEAMQMDDHKAVNFYSIPLQDFTPEAGRYNVIWIQWCIGYLTDDDFVTFFKRAKVGLKPNGLFVVKENVARNGFVLDKEDRSVTRSHPYFMELFNQCGLHVYSTKDQRGFPGELFPVKMYALVTEKPRSRSTNRQKKQSNLPAIIK